MKKKVLIFHHHGSIGGAGLSLLHIIKSIDRTKYDVSVVCPIEPPQMAKSIEDIGVRVIETKKTPVIFAHYNGGIKYAFSIRTFINLILLKKDKKNIVSIINSVEPDIIIVNSMLLSFLGKYVHNKSTEKICFCRETYQKGLFGFRTHLIKKWMSKYFEKVVFISKYDYDSTFPCNAKRILITDKVEIEKYSTVKKKDQSDYQNLLYLGGVAKIKGIHILLKAINYTDERVRFYLVANSQITKKPSLFDYFMSFFKISSMSMAKVSYNGVRNKERVTILKPSSSPENYYAKSDLIVFPSTIAHQARPIYEAGAAQIPIIISDFPETQEFAKNELNCLTFKPSNCKDLARCINKVISDEELKNRIIKNNYDMTIRYHNYNDMAKEIDDLLI